MPFFRYKNIMTNMLCQLNSNVHAGLAAALCPLSLNGLSMSQHVGITDGMSIVRVWAVILRRYGRSF